MENEDSPSDEESDEQNMIMFTETASSAGCESVASSPLSLSFPSLPLPLPPMLTHMTSAFHPSTVVSEKSKPPVPTPTSLKKYLDDAEFEHEDFTLSSAVTLRARVSSLWGGVAIGLHGQLLL